MADDNKNPLDVLEELLNDSKKGSKTDDAVAKKNEEENKKRELEQKRLAYEQKQEQQKIIDEQKLAQQKAAIDEIKNTQEYQSRVRQDSEKNLEDEKQKGDLVGFEISQLKHKKV